MSDTAASLLAALIGAVIGSVGGVVIQSWLSARAERSRRREDLVQRYLYQLQDSVESLWYRLKNLRDHGGRFVMEDQYFATSSLYSLGRVLALERILLLEGVYPQLQKVNPGMGEFLKSHRLDNYLSPVLYQYDRLVLAEAVMEREGPSFRTSTYLEFSTRYETRPPQERDPLSLALSALESLHGENLGSANAGLSHQQVQARQGPEAMRTVMELLPVIAARLAAETGIPTSLSAGGVGDPLQAGSTSKPKR